MTFWWQGAQAGERLHPSVGLRHTCPWIQVTRLDLEYKEDALFKEKKRKEQVFIVCFQDTYWPFTWHSWTACKTSSNPSHFLIVFLPPLKKLKKLKTKRWKNWGTTWHLCTLPLTLRSSLSLYSEESTMPFKRSIMTQAQVQKVNNCYSSSHPCHYNLLSFHVICHQQTINFGTVWFPPSLNRLAKSIQ